MLPLPTDYAGHQPADPAPVPSAQARVTKKNSHARPASHPGHLDPVAGERIRSILAESLDASSSRPNPSFSAPGSTPPASKSTPPKSTPSKSTPPKSTPSKSTTPSPSKAHRREADVPPAAQKQHDRIVVDTGGSAPASEGALMPHSLSRARDASCTEASGGGGSVLGEILASIHGAKKIGMRKRLCELNLDTVLAATSYRTLMRQRFGTGVNDHDGINIDEAVPTITRAFEEDYMREPIDQERRCARGDQCECRFIDPQAPFTAVEFLTLEQMQPGKTPPEPQLCVVCCRKETQFLFYDMVFNNACYNTVIQRYGNLTGGDEYAPEVMLRCVRVPHLRSMPKPIVEHCRHRYRVVEHSRYRVLCLKQTRVSPEDYVNSADLSAESASSAAHCASLASGTDRSAGAFRTGKNRGF
jgi:hypothetical protein